MNNVITLMIDSVIWESVGKYRCKVSPTPFLDSLKKESICPNRMFSHGPYTNAATRSLYTGRNTLDDFGYYFQLNTSPVTDFQVFHDAGYETYAITYPYYLIGPSMQKHIDRFYYTTGFEFNSEWGGIYKYYHDIISERGLTRDEYALLKCRTDLLFQSWIIFYKDLLSKDEASAMIKKQLEGVDLGGDLALLQREYEQFKNNKESYIDELVEKGLDHVLPSINHILIDKTISRGYLNGVYHAHKGFFSKLVKNNIKANIFKNAPTLKRYGLAFKRYFKYGDKEAFLFLSNYLGSLTTFQLMRKRWGTEKWQNMPSTRTQLHFIADEILRKRKSDKPFYISMQIEEAHNNIAFFSYDCQEDKRIEEEIRVLKGYLDELGTDFRGNIVYYLAMRYIDFAIEEFCNKLKLLGLWDNTTLLITADHGSSYTFYPLHSRRVNCFDDESYHISTIIRHPGFEGLAIDTYQNSKDILPTLLDLVGLDQSPFFKGHSMLDETRPIFPYTLGEYMGPGCPDMHASKPMWLRAQDENYLIGYKVSVDQDFEDGELAVVFDLKADPKALYNINFEFDRNKIGYLLGPMKTRFLEIKKDTKGFMDKIRNWDGDYDDLVNK